MSINPAGATLVIAGATLIVDTLSESYTFEPFDRLEFSNEKLRNAKTLCGEKRLLGETASGKPYQIVFDCMSDKTAVPLGPNSDTTFAQMKQKWKIRRWQATGAISENSNVSTLLTTAASHQVLLGNFQYYLARASGDIPYASLVALQSETFTYLTATGVSASGTALGGTISNVLITSATGNTELVIPTNSAGTTHDYYRSWSVTFEQRTLHSLSE